MISIRERQIKLTFLGYYNGEIDGIEGRKTKNAYKKLQEDYFVNNSYRHDIDGIYGINTDKLLCNLYLVNVVCSHFKLKEFKCKCGNHYCSGYPAYLDENLLLNLEKVREITGSPIIISSGIRCKIHNKNVGGTSSSRHLIGKACDFYSKPFKLLEYRKNIINKWVKFKKGRYAYTNGYSNLSGEIRYPKAPNIGNYIHGDVK